MTVKQYLSQAYRLNELIQSNKDEVAQLNLLKDSLPGTDYSKERIQTSSQGDASFAKICDKIIDLEKVIEKEVEALIALKLQIRETINAVCDNEQRLVLKLRYLNFYTWEEAAEKMNVSVRTAIRIHDVAITNVIIPES